MWSRDKEAKSRLSHTGSLTWQCPAVQEIKEVGTARFPNWCHRAWTALH
jgi:hypothetical protein